MISVYLSAPPSCVIVSASEICRPSLSLLLPLPPPLPQGRFVPYLVFLVSVSFRLSFRPFLRFATGILVCELAVRKNQLAAQTVIFLQCLITFFYVVWLSSVSINLHIVHVYTYFELKILRYSEERSHWSEQNSHGKNSTLTGFIRCTLSFLFLVRCFCFSFSDWALTRCNHKKRR